MWRHAVVSSCFVSLAAVAWVAACASTDNGGTGLSPGSGSSSGATSIGTGTGETGTQTGTVTGTQTSVGTGSTSGGTGTGTATGTGGASTGKSKPLPHGFTPATVTGADAAAAYDDWKTTQLDTSCGGGVCRVNWDFGSDTVSEGVGYGMLLAVAFNDQPTFDCLFAYYNKGAASNPTHSGLMSWDRAGCSGATGTRPYPDASASDGDLDVAMALLMADCRWTGYASKATTIVNAIKQNETTSHNNVSMLKPGDNPQWGGADCLNPSYFSPGYYRAFAQKFPADATFWTKLADDTYTLLGKMANATTGLEPNWANDQGQASTCANVDDYAIFGWDAIRTPWRIAVDYVWWGTPAAQTYLKPIATFAKGIGAANVVDEYTVSGAVWNGPSSYRPVASHNARSIGAFASAALTLDQATADAFVKETVANTNYGPSSSPYYPKSLRALYLLLASGQLTVCGNK